MSVIRRLLQDRERRRRVRAVAREWHAKNLIDPPSDTPFVYFNIPLIGRDKAPDWDRVLRNLRRTIASLRAQTSPAWRATICGQDRPDGIRFDEQVRFLHFDAAALSQAARAAKFDNAYKHTQMMRHLADTVQGDGYMFKLDADDILHPGLVAHVIEDNNGTGYVIDTGYMLDAQALKLAKMAPSRWPWGPRPFNRECGSSNMLRLDFRRDDSLLTLMRAARTHKNAAEDLTLMGLPMAPVPFPAALYVVNHGQNMREMRGKLAPKMLYLDRHGLTEPQARQVREAFGLETIWASGTASDPV